MRITFLAVSLFHIIDVVYSSVTGNDQHANISVIGSSSAAKPGQFPFMASLPFPLGSCGGTLIDPSYILTAAHCVSFYTEADTKDLTVYLNTLNVMGTDTFSIQSTVSYSVVHENFSYIGTGYVNDIALLVLSQPIRQIKPVPLPKVLATFSDKTTKPMMKTKLKSAAKSLTTKKQLTTTKPLTTKTPLTTKKQLTTTKPLTTKTPLTTKKQLTTKKPLTTTKPLTTKKPAESSPYANMDAVITGWGVQADGFNSDALMTATVTISNNSICSLNWGNKLFKDKTMMCAAKGSTSACMNDDGGPILVNGVQVGITSFFPETCGDLKFPAVFTLISAYGTWIKNAMVANPPPIPK